MAVTGTTSRSAKPIVGLDGLKRHLSGMGFYVTLWDADGAPVGEMGPGNGFCRAVHREEGPCVDAFREVGMKVIAGGTPEQMRTSLGCCIVGVPVRERRRLTMESMRQMPVGDLMALWRSKDLTDEDRELLGRNMRTVWMEHMNEMANEYLTATEEEEKVAILDRRIDEFMEFRDRMREYRESQEDDPEDEEASEERREERRRRWQSPTKEERRERAAETNPDQQAKMIFMFRKMSERAKERGIDFGWGSGRGSGRGSGGDRGRDTQRGGDRDRDNDRRGG